MKIALLVATCLIPTFAYSQAQDWIPIAKGSDTSFFFKRGTYYTGTYRQENTIGVTYKKSSSRDSTTEAGRVFVRYRDCDQKQGNIYFANLEGYVRGDTEFIFGLGTLASRMAEELCQIYFSNR